MIRSPLRALVLLVLLSGLPGAVFAEAFRVDLVVFLDQNYQRGSPNQDTEAARLPVLSGAIDRDDTAGLAAAGIEVLPETDTRLGEVWNRLNNARRFKPLTRMAWIQQSPPASGGPKIRLHYGDRLRIEPAFDEPRFGPPPRGQGDADAAQVFALDGTITLLLGRFLHLDVDLQYAQRQDGTVAGYFMRESRRLRSGELHHFDSPRFGVIAKITRPDDPAGDE